MKILVTGANGQVGHEFARLASDSDHRIVCLDRSQLDLSNDAQIVQVLSEQAADLVVNCAAYTAVDKAETEAELAMQINGIAPGIMAKTCAKLNTALIQISTDYVFSGDSQQVYREADPTGPTGAYGSSKLAGEEAVRRALSTHIILRTAWVFGAHGNNFVKTMIRLGRERDTLGVVADQWGAPTSARGIAECCLRIADAIANNPTAVNWGTYHFSGEPFTNWHGFAEAIFAAAVNNGLLEKSPTVNAIGSEQFPTPAKRPANSRLNCDKLNQHFGIAADDWQSRLNTMLNEIKSAAISAFCSVND